MKNSLWLLLLVMATLPGCKKNSGDDKKGNYIKIGNDSRTLGFVPAPDIDVFDTGINSDFHWHQLVISINNKANDINGLKNNRVVITVDVYEGTPARGEYDLIIENLNPKPSEATLKIEISGETYYGYAYGGPGKLFVTKDDDNNIKSIRFDNIQMIQGIFSGLASANIIINE